MNTQMKEYRKATLRLAYLLTLMLWTGSCIDMDINRNPYETTQDELMRENHIIGSSLKSMEALVVPTQEHLYQFVEAMCGGAYGRYFGETRVGWTEKYSTYNPKSDWLKASFSDPISEMYPSYRDIINRTNDPVALAFAKILRVAIMHRSTDMFGPIPYTKVLGDKTEGDGLSAPYDSQEEVYVAMFKELEEADEALKENLGLSAEGFKKLDNLYYGDVRKWYKYLHSLQLRMAMRIVYVKPELAREIAEKAVAAGVIENNEDNAQLHVEENRSALCFNDWKDYRIAAEIVSYMQGYNDPRLEKYFTQGKYQDDTDYYGLRIGILPSKVTDDELIQTYSNRLMTANDTYMWMTAAEVTFLRAEGALRGWAMSGDAQQLYEKAITLSFEQWGASGASGYSQNKALVPGAYKDPRGTYSAQSPSSITIAWNEDKENTRFEENLERIITQKWIAIFPLGLEAWAEHRRTGYPKLLPAVENKDPNNSVNVTIGPRRLPFPADEYTGNPKYIDQAVQMLNGPDAAGTKLWWDKKDHSIENSQSSN